MDWSAPAKVQAGYTQTDYLTRTERTTVNKSFTASGRLEVTLTRGWEQHQVLSQRDTGKSTLEDQLPALIRLLEIDKAEAGWARQEEERRSEIREERWKEVRRRPSSVWPTSAIPSGPSPSSTAAMPQRPCARTPTRSTRTAALPTPAAQAAHGWAEWIREHAERTDPLNGPAAGTRRTGGT
jgi:hypothetical protein